MKQKQTVCKLISIVLTVALAVGVYAPLGFPATFPQQGGSQNTWGTELRNFFVDTYNLTTGKIWRLFTDTYSVENYASFAAAVTDLCPNGDTSPAKTLIVPSNQTVPTAVTVCNPLTVSITGSGSFTKSGTGTITFDGPFEAPLKQVFSGFAAGDILINKLAGPEIYLQWFGAKGDGATADDTAIGVAFAAVTASGVPITVVGDFAITTQGGLTLIDNIHLVGVSHTDSIIRCTSASRQNALRYNGTTTPISNFSIENIQVIGNGLYAASTFDFGYGIFLRRYENVVIKHNKFVDFPIAAVAGGTWATNISHDWTFEDNIVTVSGSLRPMLGVTVYNAGGHTKITGNHFTKIARAIDSESIDGTYVIEDILIDGNFIELGEVSSISATNDYAGVHFDFDNAGNRIHNAAITNNTFYKAATASGAAADISIIGVTGEEVFANLAITGNLFYKSDTLQDIYLYKVTKGLVSNNVFNGLDNNSKGMNLLSTVELDISHNVFQGTFLYDILEDSTFVPDKNKYVYNTLSGTGNGYALQSASKSTIVDHTFNHGYQTAAFSTPLTPNPMLGSFIKIGQLTANLTINLPAAANTRNGHIMTFELIQSAGGGNTVTFASGYYKAGGAFTLTAAAGSTDTISFINDGGSWLEYGRNQDIK